MATETLSARQERGMVIAATKKLSRDGDTWFVPSQGGGARYAVTSNASRCTCPDFELREQPCKHIYAVEFVVRREESPDGTVTETRAVRVTYRQDWSAYNRAQTTEKETFCRLLRDLVSTVPNPEPKKTGRPRLPLSDMLFAAGFNADSAHRDHPDRSMMITKIGHRDRSAATLE